MDTLLIQIIAGLFGLVIGSFLSVCIYRIPFGKYDQNGDPIDPEEFKKSLEAAGLRPLSFGDPKRSICPHCQKQLRWSHNIPVVSWVLLRGKCAFCGARISGRYPLVELLSAFFAVLSVSLFGPTLTGVLVYLFVAALLVITFIDYDIFIIPDLITLPGTALGVLVGAINTFYPIFAPPVTTGLIDTFLGVVFGGGFLLLVSELYFRVRKIEGLGLGDVKLLAMTGAFFGPECALYTIFVGSMLGSVLGVALVLFGGRKMSQHLPFGPYLALGTVLYLYSGNQLLVRVTEFIRGIFIGF